jgi:glycosyltransferase involved in cell wall biosynthesis
MQKTVVIIPCHNESFRLDIETYELFLESNPSIFLLFVDDGSIDNTFEKISTLSDQFENVLSLQFNVNQGKAETVRKAFLHLIENHNFKYIGYFDADLSTSLAYIPKFQDILEDNSNLKMIAGARIKRLGSTITRNSVRHFFGRIVATFASRIVSLPVYDTQCGAKLFETNFVKEVFTAPFITKWLFDIEIFVRLKNLYKHEEIISGVLEYPLESWIDEGDSRIKIKDFLRVPIDLLKITMLRFNGKHKNQ